MKGLNYMWVFDRTRTEYGESVDNFIRATQKISSEEVFMEVANLFNVTLEKAKNSYATPIFHLGVAYKASISKFWLGKTNLDPNQMGVSTDEFRLTEAAKMYLNGAIDRDTFLLINIIRFQVLNSTLEQNKFTARINNRVIPLLLTLQVLREIERRDIREAYITESEFGWLYHKLDHTNLVGFVDEFLQHRSAGDPAPNINGADAFCNLFGYTGVINNVPKVKYRGAKKRILVLSARRTMVVDKILLDPPQFFPITWDDKWKWARYYVGKIDHIERFIPPKDPFVYRIVLPEGSTYDLTEKKLIVPTVFGAKIKKGDLIAIENSPNGLQQNMIYTVINDPEFLLGDICHIDLFNAYESIDQSLNIANCILGR